jgi:small-conductance mechanosensitive channel
MGQTADKRDVTGNTTKNTTTHSPFFGRIASGALVVLGVLLVIGFFLVWRTNDAMANLPFLHQRGAAGKLVQGQQTLVDQTPWQTASTLAALAVTQEELNYAHEAERLADHDVDQAFAAALRAANLKQRTLTGAALADQRKVTMLKAEVASDQAAVKAVAPGDSDGLDIAQAQLGLDQDELTDAQDNLARASGDQRGEIQQELTTRQAEMKKFDASGSGEAAVVSVGRYRTLSGLIGAWGAQRKRYALILEAKASSEQMVASLTAEHNRLEADAKGQTPGAADTEAAADKVAGLKRMSLQRQLMGIYNDRIATEQRLADVYSKWALQVDLQHRILMHLMLVQITWIVIILIVAIVVNAVVIRLTERETLDQRRMRTLRRIARLVVDVVVLLNLLLVIFGSPSQLSTVIGLVTAGLTVALQDFILGFVGWFILMGRSGIGVGDVVEINSVTGEVLEIGLFRTTLLETGNWTANGHPTGRRVAFNNKFAISGQFFNFSTAGQWMWDELRVTVPSGEDTYKAIQRIQTAVSEETEKDTKQAEAEWQRASRHHGLSQYSAEPEVNLRPSGSGVDLEIRYVTRATARYERRNRLYERVLDAMDLPKKEEPATT